MTKAGVLFVEEGLLERFSDELQERFGQVRLDAPTEWYEDQERYWPDRSAIPIRSYGEGERLGTLYVEMEEYLAENVQTGQNYVGKRVSDYAIHAGTTEYEILVEKYGYRVFNVTADSFEEANVAALEMARERGVPHRLDVDEGSDVRELE